MVRKGKMIWADEEIFIPEMTRMMKQNCIPSFREGTRYVGKLLRENNGKKKIKERFVREIKF